MVVCVVPSFRAAESIVDVVCGALEHVDRVVVVDDGCPEHSGEIVERAFRGNDRVECLYHGENRGVGAATKTGMQRALALGAQFVVKLDADAQMDPAFIPAMRDVLRAKPQTALVKGNRFYDSSVTQAMPGMRLFGNSVLTLLVRIATGLWSSIDPTNGFFMIRASSLRRVRFETLSNRYYFEISLLAAVAMRRFEIAEMEMPAIYGPHPSSLKIWRAALDFPGRLTVTLSKRLLWQYLISDMNVGSVMLVLGSVLMLVSIVYGGAAWIETLRTGIARTPGTVMLAFLPFISGFQLLVNALIYDVQFSPKVHNVSRDERLDVVALPLRSVVTS
ncbi:MAG: glycosyltransferase family 2 protein [Candidatus Eremiobacteraeota bacterium]|nr:glycosyltransferase family 2 protein [Candidatus Eremiobacteraeota bacterium]